MKHILAVSIKISRTGKLETSLRLILVSRVPRRSGKICVLGEQGSARDWAWQISSSEQIVLNWVTRLSTEVVEWVFVGAFPVS